MLRCINIKYVVTASRTVYPLCCTYSATSSPAINVPSTESLLDKKLSDDEKNSKLVSAAFASLKAISLGNKKGSKLSYAVVDAQIAKAKDVETLLKIVASNVISRSVAFKIVSTLADWASNGRISLSDFETDARFIKICSILSRKSENDVGDLSLVLGITGDDQAAKLVSSISVAQMVKVMSSLCAKRKRSVPLLRSLSFNIGRSEDKLDIKQAADVLYACAVLNFPDEVLLEKVIGDLSCCLKENKKSAVIGSILTSLGHLRYKHEEILEDLCQWIIENYYSCRIQDFTAALITLANVNYVPQCFGKFFDRISSHLNISEVNNYYTWLDVVWSLVLLDKVEAQHLHSVLTPDFVFKVVYESGSSEYITEKLKLLNINGVAKLNQERYRDVRLLENLEVLKVPLTRTKEKQLLVNFVQETFSNLLPSSSYVNHDINTGMGYMIDSACLIDPVSMKFLPLSDKEDSPSTESSSPGTKVAILVHSYHDMCRGVRNELTGIAQLTERLTVLSGYKVLSVPYSEFNSKDKLHLRVQYFENKLKSLFSNDAT